MAGRVKKAAPKKKGGYKMPDPIPNGEIIQDNLFKKEWRIGRSIGTGGFGEIYAASDNTSKAKSDYAYAVKIEPSENGPLFVENNFYIRNANKDDITQFMKNKKLSSIGMPTYYGRGTHVCKGVTYRYLVLERYGKDIWSLFQEALRLFKPTTVFQLGIQMLDVLEYIHSRGYVHADLKGANMLLGLKKGSENQVYLVDFGLATRVKGEPFTPNPKCAHDGTIEYTSRDAHLGEPTMRGDLEILGYNMLQWLTGKLPWEDSLTLPPQKVQALKENFMKDVRRNVAKLGNVPDALIKYFEYINTLEPKAIPDYAKCRKLFEGYLKTQGVKSSGKIDFTTALGKSNKSKANKSIEEEDEEDASEEPVKDQKQNGDVPKKRGRKAKVDSEVKNTENQDAPKKRSRKPKVDSENKEPEIQKETKKSNKRGSSEVIAVVKKAKLSTATPPAKENHLNIATQTSIEKRRSPRVRQVRFMSPEVGSENEDSLDSSGDIFEDSFVIEEAKPKPRRKLLSKKEETVTVTRVVKKKVTDAKKTKSYKDSATIVNGRSPPKSQVSDA